MESPLISIIVPCYNVEKYLPQCLDSIIGQTYKNIEVILVDDGSPDSSGAICDQYSAQDSRIRVIHKPNEGIVKARIDGTLISKGKYLCYVDSDDHLSINMLECFSKVISEHNPDLICCGKIKFSETSTIQEPLMEAAGLYDKARIERDIYPAIMERNDGYYFPHSIWAKCFKRELALKVHQQVDTNMRMGEDFVFIVSYLLNSSSLYILHDCLYNYRYNPNSMTNERKPYSWFFPESFYTFVNKNVDLSLFNLREQFNRALTHILMRTTVSQFYSTKSLKEIKLDINNHLKQYDNELNQARYSSFKHKLMAWALRSRKYLLLRAFSTSFIQSRLH